MPIVPSRSGRIQELLARLASKSAAERDSAVAGLTLVGSRVVEPLRVFLDEAGRSARLAALDLLETLDDRRALPLVLSLARAADEAVAARALEVVAEGADPRAVGPVAGLMTDGPTAARRQAAALALVRLQASGLVEALDPLVSRVLDEKAEPSLRLVVLNALAALDPPIEPASLRPLLETLASSAAPAVAARASGLRRATGTRRRPPEAADALLERLFDPATPDAEAAVLVGALPRSGALPLARLRKALEAAPGPRSIGRLAGVVRGAGGPTSIPVLLEALERLGDPRTARADPAAAEARGEVHRALAALDSRAALFDLREAIAVRPPAAMGGLLEAAARVGDASVLPALVGAAAVDPGFFEPCALAFAAIVRREKVRRTSAAVKAARPAHRATLDALWGLARRPRRAPRR